MDGGLLSLFDKDSASRISDFIGQQPEISPYSVLLTVSLVWLASGPVLSVVLSLYAHSFSSWIARRRGGAPLNDNGELASEPFQQFSRSLFAVYAIFGMIFVPTFIYYVLLSALCGGTKPDPFPGVLLINFVNLFVVFGYGLLCHFLAARLRALFDRR